MKITQFILRAISLCIAVTYFSCLGDDTLVESSCDDQVSVSVLIDPVSFLSFCASTTGNGVKPIDLVVDINVKGAKTTADGKSVDLQNEFDDSFTMSSNATSTQSFAIKVPACGSFQIDLLVRAPDGTCMSCCAQMQKEGSSETACPSSGKGGIPKFRVSSLKINASLSTPPPAVLILTPKFTTCKCC